MDLTVEVAARTQGAEHVSTIIRLTGVLEPATVPVAEREVKPILESPPKIVVVDLAGLKFVTSAGISFLLDTRKRLEAKRASVYFSSPQPQIRRVFDIMKALPKDSVFSSVAELDAYLAEIQRKVTEGE